MKKSKLTSTSPFKFFLATILISTLTTVVSAQSFPFYGNLQVNYRTYVQGDVRPGNGYARGWFSNNAKYDINSAKWKLTDKTYNDIAVMKFRNGGFIDFYTKAINQTNGDMSNAQLEAYNRMTIKNNGYVGIGSNNPSYPLHISMKGGTWATLGLDATIGGGDAWLLRSRKDNKRFDIRNVRTGVAALTIDPNGNIGIGSATPDNKLDVKGLIRAEEVKVELGWSDYVFYDDYQLPTLAEEEAHIEAEGHLLGFESEADMNGEIQLGDVAKRQQAKIEEMMLHLIEISKKVENLEAELSANKK